jgi:hypothetical protein
VRRRRRRDDVGEDARAARMRPAGDVLELLHPNGTPASGPGSSPRATRASIASAAARAPSASWKTNAPIGAFQPRDAVEMVLDDVAGAERAAPHTVRERRYGRTAVQRQRLRSSHPSLRAAPRAGISSAVGPRCAP